MKLDVDLSGLLLTAAEMGGLSSYLSAIRAAGKTYSDGVELAISFVLKRGGKVTTVDEVTVLELLGDEASCFKPYQDINLFYFEI